MSESNIEFYENRQIIKPEKVGSNVPYFVLAKEGPFFIPGIGEKVDGEWKVQWFQFPKTYNPIYNEISKEELKVWACTPTLPEYGAQPE